MAFVLLMYAWHHVQGRRWLLLLKSTALMVLGVLLLWYFSADFKQRVDRSIHVLNGDVSALDYALADRLPIWHTAIEMYPLSAAVVELINYTETLGYAEEYRLLHNTDWEEWINITSCFHLKKLEGDLVTTRFNDTFDLIYFDAFSPEAQPELWKESIFGKIANVCNPGAVLTTYSAKGAVRRALQATGFEVERIPGPPGKREMIRARKL